MFLAFSALRMFIKIGEWLSYFKLINLFKLIVSDIVMTLKSNMYTNIFSQFNKWDMLFY